MNFDVTICADLEKLIADEANARKNYYTFLEYNGAGLTKEELVQIEDIIAEELKHTTILDSMVYRRSQIFPESD